MGKQHNKRKKERISLQILVSYKHDSDKVDNFTYNFSTDGMFIETRNILAIGTQLKVVFESPLKRKSIEVDAEVKWVSQENSPFGFGVEFKNFTEEKRFLLNEMEKDLKEVA